MTRTYFLAACLFFSLPAWSQTTATIVGTVADKSGAVIPDVMVTVTNTETGVTRRVLSNERGLYIVGALPWEPTRSRPSWRASDERR